MRKLFLAAILFPAAISLQAQRWVDIGLKGSWGPNWLFNKNIMNDQEFNNLLSYGYNFGGKVGLNFSDFHEVTFDVLSGKFNQKFNYNLLDTATGSRPLHSKNFSYQTLDLALLYRHNKDGRYFETGPQYTIVKKASGSNGNDPETDGEIRDNFVKNYASFLFGFGGYFIGTENFGITFGARFCWSFGDVISEKGKSIQYPSSAPYPGYSSYEPSHAFTAMVVMEFNYDFAYLARAKCSSRRKLIFF